MLEIYTTLLEATAQKYATRFHLLVSFTYYGSRGKEKSFELNENIEIKPWSIHQRTENTFVVYFV